MGGSGGRRERRRDDATRAPPRAPPRALPRAPPRAPPPPPPPSSSASRRSRRMLPEHNDYAGKNVGKRRKKRKTGALQAQDGHLEPAPAAANAAPATSPQILAIVARRADMPRCDVCSKSFTSAAQLERTPAGKSAPKSDARRKASRRRRARTPPRGFPPKAAGIEAPRAAARARRTRRALLGPAAAGAGPRPRERSRTARCAAKPSRARNSSGNTRGGNGTRCDSAGRSRPAGNRTRSESGGPGEGGTRRFERIAFGLFV